MFTCVQYMCPERGKPKLPRAKRAKKNYGVYTPKSDILDLGGGKKLGLNRENGVLGEGGKLRPNFEKHEFGG